MTTISIHAPGTIVTRQPRGVRRIHHTARILDHFTTTDKLGRRQIWYRCHVIELGVERNWPHSHCVVITPTPLAC